MFCTLSGCNNTPLADALRTKQDYGYVRTMVDRYGYHYFRGSAAPNRHYEAPYYNNTGYYNTVDPRIGKLVYAKAYENYNNGYYKGGFYGNEYYHNGFLNNGFYNPGYCRGKDCFTYKRWMK